MSANNPHDIFFREIFTDPDKARELIKITLPGDITDLFDWQGFSCEEGTFIDEDMREYHSDIVFSVPLEAGYQVKIYLLFEHKSYHDSTLLVQLLGYMSIMYRKMKTLCPVIPLVFYHGRREWTLPDRFSDMFDLPGNLKKHFEAYIPDFRFELLDLRCENVEEMIISLTMKVLLYTFKNIRDFEDTAILDRFIVLAHDLFYEDTGLKVIEKMLRYLYLANEIKPERVRSSIERLISMDKGDIAMTTGERLIQQGYLQGIEKGIEKGREEGIEQGIEEGKLMESREILVRFLKKKFGDVVTDRDISRIQSCNDPELLKDALETLLSADNKSAVLERLV